jgi:hypothetical protein
MLVAAMQRLDPERHEGSKLTCQLHERKRSAPFVATLLAVPLMSHLRRDLCPGYPRRDASFLGNHRSYNRGQLLNFLGRPSAFGYAQITTDTFTLYKGTKRYLFFVRCDGPGGFGSGHGNYRRIAQASWISHPTCGRVLGQPWHKVHFNDGPLTIHLSTHFSKSSSSWTDQGPCLATGSQTRRT